VKSAQQSQDASIQWSKTQQRIVQEPEKRISEHSRALKDTMAKRQSENVQKLL
jgi:hypothetical protein